MTDSSAQLETLQQANREAHQKLNRLTRELIAVAGAIGFARSHFSDDDEWTKGDELIVRICGPLEEMLHDMSNLVANSKIASDRTSNAISEYYRTRNANKSNDENKLGTEQ